MIEKRAVVEDDPKPEGVVKEAMAKIIDNEKKKETNGKEPDNGSGD